MTGRSSQANHLSRMKTAQKMRAVEEVVRRRNAGENMTRKSIAEWVFEELNLTFMPHYPITSRLFKKEFQP